MTSIDDLRARALRDASDILDMYQEGTLSISEGNIPCVVFDIDDTLICSRTGTVIVPMLILYQRILSMGIDIYIITARLPRYLRSTLKELESHGISGYADIYMVGYDGDKAMKKSIVRELIEDRGYDIILNIGDDPGDMMHGHYVYGIKLPYLLPMHY
jgi:hydroxymethylpyrimidine pyrophosphatase-like HAD family hydrolase